MKRRLGPAALAPPALAVALAVAAGLVPSPSGAPIGELSHERRVELAPIGSFSLEERSGRVVGVEDLRGHVWIVGFAFTRCAGPCPRLTGDMAGLHRALAGKNVRLLTFSVDPEHDTPAVLARYAQNFGADDRWWFLTGPTATIERIARESFITSMARDPNAPVGESVSHSTKLYLLGPEGRVLGWYDSESQAAKDRLLIDAAALAAPGRRAVLPRVNAALNATSALLLLLAWLAIRAEAVAAHRNLMLAALGVSAAFLACYVAHHVQHGSTPFGGHGWLRTAYLGLLATHVVLAVPVVPLALVTAALGLRGSYERHVKLARVTFPLWLYVSASGVVVYLLLYVIA